MKELGIKSKFSIQRRNHFILLFRNNAKENSNYSNSTFSTTKSNFSNKTTVTDSFLKASSNSSIFRTTYRKLRKEGTWTISSQLSWLTTQVPVQWLPPRPGLQRHQTLNTSRWMSIEHWHSNNCDGRLNPLTDHYCVFFLKVFSDPSKFSREGKEMCNNQKSENIVQS